MIVPLSMFSKVQVTRSPSSIVISDIVLVLVSKVPLSLSQVTSNNMNPGGSSSSNIFQLSSGITEMNPVRSVDSPGGMTSISSRTSFAPSNITNLKSKSTTPSFSGVFFTILRNDVPARLKAYAISDPNLNSRSCSPGVKT